ncbi:unnamed protein product [Pleuronectes platessa]|uniref:Uncharacterized protein n=1 Tax=Pleuronectes platessa TaxID=8262 RepID=A0A9N7TXL9_PLEPL|nr:unnamed protein product [Pleuronectes platessa]
MAWCAERPAGAMAARPLCCSLNFHQRVVTMFLPGLQSADLSKGISELLLSLRSNLAASDGPKHNVPEVLPAYPCHMRQRHSYQWPAGGHSVGLGQCSTCSSLHKAADIGPADGLRTFYGPVQLS